MNLYFNYLSDRIKAELKNRKNNVIAMLIFALSFPAVSQATLINYATSPLGGGLWQYDYTIKNDTIADPIAEFSVYFPETLYGNLAVLASPSDWDSIVIQPDIELPAEGYFDALTLSTGLAFGTSTGLFSVTFTYLGFGIPATQAFDVYDNSFNLLDSGITLPINPVPEPHMFVMLILGLVLLASFRAIRGTLRC